MAHVARQRSSDLFPTDQPIPASQMIGRKADEMTLRNLINPSDGNVIDWDKAPPPKAEKK